MTELINWLVCGTLLAAATHALSLCSPRVSASLRYHLWWLALATVFAAPLLPVLLPEKSVSLVRAVQPLPAVEVSAVAPFGWLFVMAWAAIAAYSLTRVVVAAVVLRRRKREAIPFPTDIEKQLPLWNARVGSRAARLCVSPVVRSAAVFGGRQPGIAVSPALLQTLSARELDLVLMHEWAHVQRYDDVANAVQQVVRSVFGMHPGVRWCTRQLDLQRELACDARVVNETGSAKAYAACLARLAEMVNVRGGIALAPSVLAGSHLTARVHAVLRARPRVSRWQTCGFVTTAITVLVAVAASTARVAAVRAPVHAAAEMVANVLPQAATVVSAPRPFTAADTASPSPPGRPRARSAAQLSTKKAEPQDDAAVHPAHTDGPPLADSSIAVPELATTEFGVVSPAGAVALPAAPEASQEDPGTWSRVADAGATVGRKTSDAGVAIGRKSSDGARSTAGFFSRMSKSIAGRF